MDQFFSEFSDFLDSLSSQRGHFMITGDLNFHFDDANDASANEMESILTSFNLQQHVHQSTHRNGHTLDVVITRADDSCVISVDARDHGFPDHFPVSVQTSLKKTPAHKTSITFRSTKTIDPAVMKEAIAQSSLTTATFADHPLNGQVELYHNELTSILDRLAPLKKRTITCRTNAEWFNDGIRKAKQDRRRAEKKWRSTGTHIDRQLFMEARSKVNSLIDDAKRDHYRDTIASCQNNRQLFGILNKLLGRKQTTALPTDTLRSNWQKLSATTS